MRAVSLSLFAAKISQSAMHVAPVDGPATNHAFARNAWRQPRRSCLRTMRGSETRQNPLVDPMYGHLTNEELLVLYQEKRDPHAFASLHARLHLQVRKFVARVLGPAPVDANVIEDLAEQSWTLLCEREGVLVRFKPGKGRALAYLGLLVAHVACAYRRHRRIERQLGLIPLGNLDPIDCKSPETELLADLMFFPLSLTRSERICWQTEFLGNPWPAGLKKFSNAYLRQLRSRVLKKERNYFARS
jgi:hypothetical protein